jgi:hypothetical protein
MEAPDQPRDPEAPAAEAGLPAAPVGSLAAPRLRNRDRPWHVLVEAATDFPLSVGGRVAFETPARVRVGGYLGVLADPYLDLAETVASGVSGDLDPATMELARSALESSLVARGFVSWSPFRGRGFYLLAGYSYIHFGGDLTSTEVLEQATNYSGEDPVNGRARLDAGLHGIHGELGYRFYAGPVTFRLSLGFTGTVAAHTRIDVTSDEGQEEANQLAEEGETVLQDTLTRYAMAPTLGFGVGYDLGF